MIRMVLAAGGLAAVLFSAPANAKIFRNSYVSFELPDRWECKLEQTEFVCRSTGTGGAQDDPRQAAIILTAKEVGPQDNLGAYEAHLKKPYLITGRDGKVIQSDIKQVSTRQINNHPWVDGMHLNSEIPNYFTRYLATVKDKIAVLITFSAHQMQYTKYSSEFYRSIESLRLVFTRSSLGSGGGANLPGTELFGQGAGAGGGAGNGQFDFPDENSGRGGGFFGGDVGTIGGIGLLLAAVAAYLFLKKKKDGNKKKRGPTDFGGGLGGGGGGGGQIGYQPQNTQRPRPQPAQQPRIPNQKR